MFSRLQRSPAELASSRADTDRRLASVMGSDAADAEEIVSRARVLYSDLLVSGKARRPCRQPRLDKCQERQTARPSEKQWVRDRRNAVLSAVNEERRRGSTAISVATEDLPQGLQKELANQKAEAGKRKAEAYLDGLLLPEEAGDEVREEAARREKQKSSHDKTRRKSFTQVTALTKLKTQQQSPAWALRDLPSPGYFADCTMPQKKKWGELLANLGVSVTEDLKQAKVVISNDVSNLARKYKAFAALMGAVILSGDVLNKQAGLRLGHETGCNGAVSVFCTEKFITEQPGLTMLVREACERGGRCQGSGGWKAKSMAEVLQTRGRREAVILHGRNEEVQVQGNNKTQKLTGDTLAAWLAKKYIDHNASAWIKGSNAT